MNTINIKIFSQDKNYTNLFLNLDNNSITLNNKTVKININDFLLILDKLLAIFKEWENINLIKFNEHIEIIVDINLTTEVKKYEFKQNIPVNANKLYNIINELENHYE